MISMCYWHYNMIYDMNELCYAVLATKQAIRDRRVRYLCSYCILSLISTRLSGEEAKMSHLSMQSQIFLHRELLRHTHNTNSAHFCHNSHLLSSVGDSISILSIISTMSVSNSCCYYCCAYLMHFSYRYLTSMRYLPPYSLSVY